ncbi:MAG TPA: preprotein translocase subunit SecG [Acidimicrobiia bacterium]|nr:preprotein translocase subunit SecG [Acidimicrobiia bacterium]
MEIITVVTVVLHVIFSLGMIALILLHAGRGGGLSDMFGGGAGPSAMRGSTVVERNLDRLTVVAGLLFATTTIALTLLLS